MGIRKVLGKPLVIIPAVVITTLVVLYAFGSVMPKADVVESGSMQHSGIWTAGVINTGDIVFEEKISNPLSQITTYVQGRSSNFSTYGDYGNVIIYETGSNYSIVHRAMFYLEWNQSTPVVVGYSGQSWLSVANDTVIIKDVGYAHRTLAVPLGPYIGMSGYVTMGDNNLANSNTLWDNSNSSIAADQNIFAFNPINISQVKAIAWGHIPWAGLIKLNIMRSQGEWQYYDDVPQYSYLYLFLSSAFLTILVAVSIHLINSVEFRRHQGKR